VIILMNLLELGTILDAEGMSCSLLIANYSHGSKAL